MSFWGSLGKGLLKVGKIAAPIALGATGVGLPAAMAVGGGLNALDKKVNGGSWKGALGAGLVGAGTGALGAGAGSAMAKGFSPNSSMLAKLTGNMGKGFVGPQQPGMLEKFGKPALKMLGQFGKNPQGPMAPRRGYGTPPFVPPPSNRGVMPPQVNNQTYRMPPWNPNANTGFAGGR